MTFRSARRILIASACLVGAACATDDPTSSNDDVPAALRLLAGDPSPYADGDDVWQVFVCRVPTTVGHRVYADDPSRLDITAADLTARLVEGVGDWFGQLSHGRYRPEFREGGEVAITVDGDGDDCVAAAVARAGGGVTGVLVVADARHRDTVSGGWGRPGTCGSPCRSAPVTTTGRAVYVGAADFAPEWGDHPPLDLVQHELGHALDLPHSGVTAYTSPIDMMSDSSAPRVVRADRRDAPDTIAANRIALGWLPLADVVVVDATTTVMLAASTSNTGRRVAVVPLDDTRLITIELLVPQGANDHLPAAGVAVHLIDQSAGACSAGRPCTGQYRRQIPLADDGSHPGVPLAGSGAVLDLDDIGLTVLSIENGTCHVAIEVR
jgi:hypothetical protein